MSKLPFWVMEQQPGPVNWAQWNPAPLPGMVRLWSWEAFAHGAGCVSYFRWRQAPFAQEQMHAGLNTPDNRLDVGGNEAAQVADEIRTVLAANARRQRGDPFEGRARLRLRSEVAVRDSSARARTFTIRASPSSTTRRCARSGSMSISCRSTRRSTATA